ncbi:S8 family serine peptidase [Spirillospora sp. NPDC050679]
MLKPSVRHLAGPLAVALPLTLAGPVRADAPPKDWFMRMVYSFRDARQVSRGEGVKIALLGDGVAATPALKGALVKEGDLVGLPRGRGRSDTPKASMLVSGGPTAAARRAVPGLVSKATLLPVRIYPFGDEPGARQWWNQTNMTGKTVEGIRYAADAGAQVIVVPLCTSSKDGVVRAAVHHAHRKNAVVIAPSCPTDTFPKLVDPIAVPGVIGVGAATAKGVRDRRATGQSSALAVTAPGIGLPVPGAKGRYLSVRGAAAALSWVTAAVTMIKSRYPKLPPAQVYEAVVTSARHPAGPGRFDFELGFGYIDPAAALKKAGTLSAPPVAAKPVVADSARFGDGPETVRAVPYNVPWLVGFGALGVAGLAALGAAFFLAVRRRPARPSDAAGT